MLKPINLFLSCLFVFLFFLHPASDADFGWHYRYGESFFQNFRLLKQNTFSFTMPNYIWPNHSWGYDLLVYQIFERFSFIGLSLSASLIIMFSYLVSVFRKNLYPGLALSVLIFAYFGQYLLNTGLRSQIISLLFIVILWRLLSTSPKRIFLTIIPLLFLIWANLHGQFIIGLGLVMVYCFTSKRHKFYLSLFLMSFLATLFNPYGIKLHYVAIEHLTAPTLQYIFEWMPWEINTQRMLLFLFYSTIFWFLLRRKNHRPSFFSGANVTLLITNLLSIKARRMIPVFLLFSLPQFVEYIYLLKPFKKIPKNILILFDTLILSVSIAYIFYYQVIPSQPLTQTWESYCLNLNCSENLIRFLNHNDLKGNVFNAYSLGSYLILKSPNIKPFIDGRMVAWHEDNWYPFTDYNTIVHNLPGSKDIFRRYSFDYFIVYNQSEITPVLENVEKYPVIFRDLLFTVFENPHKNLAS